MSLGSFFQDKETKTGTQQNSQESQSRTGLSDQVKDYWSSISGLYSPSSWKDVDPNAYQTDAANRTSGYASGLNPAFAQANQIGGTGISGSDISRFMSPYTENVVNATRANFAQENARQDAQTNANAAKLGALSGTQPLVGRAISQSMRQPGQDATIAGLYDKGFTTALGAAGQSTGMQLQGLNSANAIAGQQSGINQTGFGQGTQLWNQDWQNSRGQAAQAAQGAQVLASLSPQSGVTSTGSSTGSSTGVSTADPSPFSVAANVAGMGLKAAALPSDERIKENIKPIGETYDGQQIYKYNIKGSPKTEIGLMAQEVEQRDPDAVGSIAGIKMVNYDRATKGAEKDDPGMAAGGSVGVKPRESDPHHRLTTAFDAVRGMLERARGGSVLPRFQDGGPAVGPSYDKGWNTTVTPASWTDNIDKSKFNSAGDELLKMGKPKDQSGGGGDDGSGALRSAQQDLSSFMNRNSIRPGYNRGGKAGEYGGEGDEYGGGDSDLPSPVAGGSGGSGIPPGPTRATMKGYVPETAQNFTNAVKRFEGYTPKSTWDYKQNSVGYGTKARYPGEVIDRPEADRRLNTELDSARGQVTAFAPNLDPGTQAALTSLTYNAGAKWMTSGLGAAIRAGDMDTARRLFTQYNKAGGEVLPGLVKRRAEEATWMGGDVPATTGSAVMGGGDGGSSGLAPASQASGPPAEKTWVQRNLPGLSEGILGGKPATANDQLAMALMSVKGPRFGGPGNAIADAMMKMDDARRANDAAKNQVDQFGVTKGLEDRKLALSENKNPAEIALLQAQAAAQKAAQENGKFVPYDPEKGVMNARTGEIKPPSQTGVNTQRIADEAYAKDSAKLLNTSVESADNARSMVGNIREMKALSDNMYTGALADQRLAAAKIGRMLGLDFDPLKISNSEQFQGKMQEFVLTAAQKLKPLSNSDITFVEKGMPGLARDPSTIGPMLESMERIAQRNILIEKYRQGYYSQGKRPDNEAIEARVDKEIPPPSLKPPPPGGGTGAGSSAGLSPAPSSTASGNALPEGTIINGPAGRLVLKGGKWEPYSSAADERARDLARSREVGASARGGAFGTPTDGY